MILWYLTTSNKKKITFKFPGNVKCGYQALIQANERRNL